MLWWAQSPPVPASAPPQEGNRSQRDETSSQANLASSSPAPQYYIPPWAANLTPNFPSNVQHHFPFPYPLIPPATVPPIALPNIFEFNILIFFQYCNELFYKPSPDTPKSASCPSLNSFLCGLLLLLIIVLATSNVLTPNPRLQGFISSLGALFLYHKHVSLREIQFLTRRLLEPSSS